MIEQGLINSHFVGRNGFYWWIGQIVAQKNWEQNIGPRPTEKLEEQKGFAFRYKVRIMGYHTAASTELPDEQLPWATIMFPVTAGVSGGAVSSPNLRQGDFVYGFFMDGEDAQQPVIMGVMGYNQYTAILKEPPEVGFVPFSGYTTEDIKPRYSLPLVECDIDEVVRADEVEGKEIVNCGNNEASITQTLIDDGANKEQENGEKKPIPQSTSSKCKKIDAGPIQTKVKNMLKEIKEIKKTQTDWLTKVSNKVDDVQREIDKALDNATRDITGDVKKIVDNIEEGVLKEINDALRESYKKIPFPSLVPGVTEEAAKANDELACAFRNIMKNLFGMVGKFLKQIVDRFISTPLCAIENFVGSLLGKITGMIDSAVESALGPIKSLLDGLGAATSALDDVVGFAEDALSFLICDEDPNCSDLKDWNPTDGPTISATLDVGGMLGKAKNAYSMIKEGLSGISNIGSAISDIAKNADFSDAFTDTCNVGPIFCGPPKIEFFGGGGSGGAGNAIISAAGSLLGVDIINAGKDYTTPPMFRIEDDCDNGTGATGTVVINQDGQIEQVVIEEPGAGYISVQDGSQGGDGYTWAAADETTVKKADGTYETPYKPGTVITVCPGDEITEPGGRVVIMTGSDCEQITTKFPEDPEDQLTRGKAASLSTGDYPVILEIEDMNIVEPGLAYNPKDKVIIEPSNGAEVKIKTDSLGGVIGVDVIKGGIGFTEEPKVYIQSDTGYNARLIPVFKVNRVGEDIALEFVSPGAVIQVVDCVGKI
tara:strand:+ start:2170 stop:4470 length:2301 start_codon:yes stop_codon:yes gene_type:complete